MCWNVKKLTLSKENSKGEWGEITEIYRKYKKKTLREKCANTEFFLSSFSHIRTRKNLGG